MIARCKPSFRGRHLYFDRGIGVCNQWGDFETFLMDVGVRPKDTSLDRINNDLGYFPKNCRWATRKEQGRNTRVNTFVEYEGELINTTELAERFGVSSRLLSGRLKLGWPVKKALTTAVTPYKKPSKRQAKDIDIQKISPGDSRLECAIRELITGSEVPISQIAHTAEVDYTRVHRWLNRKTKFLGTDDAERLYYALSGEVLDLD